MRDFQLPGRSAVFAQNGLCATSHPLAAKVAIETLEAGGNAVDAALAGGVLLGLCEPQMTGIGGDCFVLFTPPGSDDVIALNGSGRSPAGLSADALRGRGLAAVPLRGVESVTLPGAMDAFCQLSADWGALGLDRVLAPAIRYADEGVPVAPRVASDWTGDAGVLQGRARDYYLLAGQAPKPGQLFRAPGQAEVLRRVARQGRAGYYEGDVADDLIASLAALGGSHNHDDLAQTRCTYTDPVAADYAGHEVLEHPPNGQGATALLMLNILKHFDIAGLDPSGAMRVHLEAEATKLAYDTRNRVIADPDHTARLDHMLSPETAARLAGLIRHDAVLPPALPGAEPIYKDTIYITVVDKDRMAVSLIYSIFWGFGTGLASDRFGILFQNRGAGFTLTPGHPNEAAGNKRPMHTIIPGMIRKGGRLSMAFGVMGGGYQPAGHARFVSNIADFGMDPQQAMDLPRSFADKDKLGLERGYGDDVRATLAALGHDVTTPDIPLGGSQAVALTNDGGLVAGSDHRKDGCALGY